MTLFSKKLEVPVPVEKLYDYHMAEGALERITQGWTKVKVLSGKGKVENGSRVEVELSQGPLRIVLLVEHFDVIPNQQFKDRQLKGPYKSWVHAHLFEKINENSSSLTDSIDYELKWYQQWAKERVAKEIERVFKYRDEIIKNDLTIMSKNNGKTMKILIAGSNGLVGTELKNFLTTQGNQVEVLSRKKDTGIYWNPEAGEVDTNSLEGFDAIVNLAGENIGNGRWTDDKKKKILKSRIDTTTTLANAIQKLKNPPKVFINASAIGYYGSREEAVDENSSPGKDFLADVCMRWEEVADLAKREGVRVVKLRTGMVLSPKGGALGNMLTPFQMCLGGNLGTGKQYMSWVAIDDLLAIIYEAIQNKKIEGPLDAVSPQPITNEEFTKTLGKVLGRPTFMAMPVFMIKIIFGQMGEDLFLSNQKVLPKKLENNGYKFLYPDLEQTLRHLLGK